MLMTAEVRALVASPLCLKGTGNEVEKVEKVRKVDNKH